MRQLIKYVFILNMEINKIISFVCLAVLLNLSAGVKSLYSNSLMGCCGLFDDKLPKENPAAVKFEPLKKKVPPPFNPRKKEKCPTRFKSEKRFKNENVINRPDISFKSNGINGFGSLAKNRCGPSGVVSNRSSSPALFYYAPRMKSIRVNSAPNIDGWERSLREEMRLNGRSKHTVNRLLFRIQNYYEDSSICATDYAPGKEGYQPSAEAREIAESRIRGSVQSMAELLLKSGNSKVELQKSPKSLAMIKGELDFINTQLDKIGKPRVGINELRDILALKINPPAPKAGVVKEKNPEAVLADVEVPDVDENIQEFINQMPNPRFPMDQMDLKNLVSEKIDQLYLSFAGWLADNDKTFPSQDADVNIHTKHYFELVNKELMKLGKKEDPVIFREKTLAHLDDILDERGENLLPNEKNIDNPEPEIIPDGEDPLFRGDIIQSRTFVHLASLPGKVVPTKNSNNFNSSLPHRKVRFDDSGNRIVERVMDNLPGRVIH